MGACQSGRPLNCPGRCCPLQARLGRLGQTVRLRRSRRRIRSGTRRRRQPSVLRRRGRCSSPLHRRRRGPASRARHQPRRVRPQRASQHPRSVRPSSAPRPAAPAQQRPAQRDGAPAAALRLIAPGPAAGRNPTAALRSAAPRPGARASTRAAAWASASGPAAGVRTAGPAQADPGAVSPGRRGYTCRRPLPRRCPRQCRSRPRGRTCRDPPIAGRPSYGTRCRMNIRRPTAWATCLAAAGGRTATSPQHAQLILIGSPSQDHRRIWLSRGNFVVAETTTDFPRDS